ncbi:uncharacterized protein [Argopecten irradians]|uniref:uncharacterized protein n=1 Tax=Argopecten irradians TaxID=31199 RepID=UPI0037209B97
MKELVLQTFSVLLMVCIILTIIFFGWENEIRQTFLKKKPLNVKKKIMLRDSIERNLMEDLKIKGNLSHMNLYALSLKYFGQEVTNLNMHKKLKANQGNNSKETGGNHQTPMDVFNNQSNIQFKTNVNITVTDSVVLHPRKREKYLVYDCSKSHKENCGGWSDRLSGILSTLVLAALTNRTFKINFDSPCMLSEFLRPNLYDWTMEPSDVANRSSSYHILSNSLYHKMGKELTPTGLHKYFQADVCYVRMNWDLTRKFRRYPNIQKYAPWITDLQFSDIYYKIFNTLFKPSEGISKDLSDIRENINSKKTVCAHLRMGGNPSMRNDHARNDKNSLKVVWSFLDNFNSSSYNIFIATDDDSVRHGARDRYRDRCVDIKGNILHIDQTSYRQGDVCEGFKKQLLDFLFLTTCDVLVLSNSGFGMMAAYLRTLTTGLYCWTNVGIVPCSRYTVHDFYPKPVLAPE